MTRILIADDYPMVRRYVREALEDDSGWKVCGEASTGREAISMTIMLKPDIVLLDLCMPEINGLEATRAIHQKCPETEILILTMHDTPELILEALASGARACLLKSDIHHLIDAVQYVLENPQCTSESGP
jgi:DNA-binding NarL/FixJ family response regulator